MRERYKYDRTVQRMLDILDIYGLSHLVYNKGTMKSTNLKINLKNLIIAKYESISDFAEKAGISRTNLQRILKGQPVELGTALVIAKMLDLTVHDIWETSD